MTTAGAQQSSSVGFWLLRIWSAAAAAIGVLLMGLAAWIFWAALRNGLAGSLLNLFLATSWFLAFEALFFFIAWIGFQALAHPGAESLRRLIALTSCFFWLGLGGLLQEIAFKLNFAGESRASHQTNILFTYASGTASLFFCRAMYCWMRKSAPLPLEEREKLPSGIKRDTLKLLMTLFGLSLSGETIQILDGIKSPKASDWIVAIGPFAIIAVGLTISIAAYSVLKRALVREPLDPPRQQSHVFPANSDSL